MIIVATALKPRNIVIAISPYYKPLIKPDVKLEISPYYEPLTKPDVKLEISPYYEPLTKPDVKLENIIIYPGVTDIRIEKTWNNVGLTVEVS